MTKTTIVKDTEIRLMTDEGLSNAYLVFGVDKVEIEYDTSSGELEIGRTLFDRAELRIVKPSQFHPESGAVTNSRRVDTLSSWGDGTLTTNTRELPIAIQRLLHDTLIIRGSFREEVA